MTTFRNRKKQNPFVQIDKTCLEDSRLTWKARGILAYLLCKPDGWQVRIGDLVSKSPEGVTAVKSAIKELEAAGYMLRKRVHCNGKLDWETEVYETPQIAQEETLQAEQAQSSEGQSIEDQSTENQSIGNLSIENKPYSNNESSNKTTRNKSFTNKHSHKSESKQASDKSSVDREAESRQDFEAKPLQKFKHSTQRSEQLFTQNISPWRLSRKRNDYKPGFVEFIRISHLPRVTPWHGSNSLPTEADAKSWISQREYDEKGLDAIYAKWDEYEKSLCERPEPQQPAHHALSDAEIAALRAQSLTKPQQESINDEF